MYFYNKKYSLNINIMNKKDVDDFFNFTRNVTNIVPIVPIDPLFVEHNDPLFNEL